MNGRPAVAIIVVIGLLSYRARLRAAIAFGALTVVLLGAAACAHFGGRSSEDAVALARRTVCGPAGSATDAACIVREVSRVPGGYRVVIDRRPPAGDDRVAVSMPARGGRIRVEPVTQSAGSLEQPLVVGLFIASIEEGARAFTPVRLLPFDHADAFNHEFPNALVNHTSEVEALVHLGEQAGLRLRTTLLRYPAPPVETWPYPEFAPPPLDCIRGAAVERVVSEPTLAGLRALVVADGIPLVFIVDTRGLSLERRQMQRVTSMGLDLTRAEFLEQLEQSVAAGSSRGCRILVYPGPWIPHS